MVNDNLKKVCHWFKCNKLSVNSKKCNYIVFRSSSRRLELEDLYVRLNEDVIPRVDCTKFLGVIIDEQLTWKPHIAYIQNKIAKNIGIIFRLSTFMPKHDCTQDPVLHISFTIFFLLQYSMGQHLSIKTKETVYFAEKNC